MNTKTTITEAVARVSDSGRRAAAHERVTEIIKAVCFDGCHIRQGDVVFTCFEGPVSHEELIEERQLAPGNTQGSRHVVEGDASIYARRGDALTGPLIKVGSEGCVVTHPEHRHYRLPAQTVWGVTYERDLDAEEIDRVRD